MIPTRLTVKRAAAVEVAHPRPGHQAVACLSAEAELDVPPVCADCRRESRDDENAEDEWRVESDGVGDLLVFCAECWRREFGSS